MRKLSPQDIPRLTPSDARSADPHPISVIVHNVRSIYNVGSMFRTADAARVEHLYLTGYTGTPDHKNLHKTALGAQDVVSWSAHDDVTPVINDLRAEGYSIGVLEITDEPLHPAEAPATSFPLAIIVGNEVTGVEDDIVSLADLAFELPQYGMKHSLNVSVAAGMALSHLVRRFRHLHDLQDTPGNRALETELPDV
ncbi:rRNA methyltransferase [Longibacter salinarum]|uniref:rRNA methyltransferase n=1 Tax=Longibacter salinarum TaxID=1850348 RepID=A0A2A8D2U0_9BACT|nr:TrmH family RNA methyltransferase [Longibacter salinarum]PEN15113.1 rRNA methyltransferase [Longibacter salinarum]